MVFEFIYTSVLASTIDVRNVADIIRRSRSYNRLNGLTGLLVFDGQRFCQYLEGDRESVLLLAGKIEADPRHLQFHVLNQRYIGTERRFGDSSMAYGLDTQNTLIDSISRTPGPMASAFLQQHIPFLDFQPP